VDVKRPLERFDKYQQRRRWLAIPIAVVKKFGEDQGGSLASLIAYYAFFSIFPLLLVFVTILGFALSGDPGALKSVKASVLGHFPFIGDQIQKGRLTGHATALVIGIATSLLAGIGVTTASGQAFDRVWAVPFKHRPNFLAVRLQGLTVLGMLGAMFLFTQGASALVSGVVGGAGTAVAGIALSLLLNYLLFLAAYRLLGSIDVPLRALLPGAVLAGTLFEVMELVGAVLVKHFIAKASNTYGTFAIVIGILTYLHLGAQMTIYCAEINVVLHRKLWPRTLLGPPEEPADEAALAALAKIEERSDVEVVDVTFTNGNGASVPPGTRRDGRDGPPIRWSSQQAGADGVDPPA
jgi:uncharacterized BrkB/YihY/UPF0761 family membrane protein